jgi:DNA-binding transcriptional ArsR family regulator
MAVKSSSPIAAARPLCCSGQRYFGYVPGESDLNALSIRVQISAVKKTLLHGLFPAVRAETLRLLFTNRGQELYTRELARLSFLALRTIQDELAKLEAANLILSRTNGYHRFYRANPKHPLYRALTEVVRKGADHTKANPRALPSRRSARTNKSRP